MKWLKTRSGQKNQNFIYGGGFEICFRLFNIEDYQLIIKPKIQAYDLFYLEFFLLSICIFRCAQTYWFYKAGQPTTV